MNDPGQSITMESWLLFCPLAFLSGVPSSALPSSASDSVALSSSDPSSASLSPDYSYSLPDSSEVSFYSMVSECFELDSLSASLIDWSCESFASSSLVEGPLGGSGSRRLRPPAGYSPAGVFDESPREHSAGLLFLNF